MCPDNLKRVRIIQKYANSFSYTCTLWSIFPLCLCLKFANTLFTRICREFENYRDLRTLSGKLLRQKYCYQENFHFSDSDTLLFNQKVRVANSKCMHTCIYIWHVEVLSLVRGKPRLGRGLQLFLPETKAVGSLVFLTWNQADLTKYFKTAPQVPSSLNRN